ncbi:hypothetical protein DYB32_005098 [Aphanomyces invadans]|uniref:Glycoside hydrolase family 5 domain-containing protein n=1 Tax=Aphanomyces invadans TaxID=157072 RepID=A0A418AVH4_9STRA|nr:hypothetical protein DYB32_005098 [Aphanomyces invadans]
MATSPRVTSPRAVPDDDDSQPRSPTEYKRFSSSNFVTDGSQESSTSVQEQTTKGATLTHHKKVGNIARERKNQPTTSNVIKRVLFLVIVVSGIMAGIVLVILKLVQQNGATSPTGTNGGYSSFPVGVNPIYVQGPNGFPQPVSIKGISCRAGMETADAIPYGLWHSPTNGTTVFQLAAFLARNNFNSVRLPLCIESILNDRRPNPDLINTAANRAINSQSYMGLLSSIIRAFAFRKMSVLLDLHTLTPTDAGGSWTSDNLSELSYLAAVDVLATKLCNDQYWNVIGIDLKNKPYAATWGDNGPNDWAIGAPRIANRMLKGCPNWLAFVQGTVAKHTLRSDDNTQVFTYTDWWGGGLQNEATAPLKLSIPSKLVYAPHYYSPSEYPQSYFVQNGVRDHDLMVGYTEYTNETLKRRVASTMSDMFGFLTQYQQGAVVLGEFGGLYAKDAFANLTNRRVIELTMDVASQPGFAGGYVWALNPETQYEYNPSNTKGSWQEGLVGDTWTTANGPYLTALKKLDSLPYLQPWPCSTVREPTAAPQSFDDEFVQRHSHAVENIMATSPRKELVSVESLEAPVEYSRFSSSSALINHDDESKDESFDRTKKDPMHFADTVNLRDVSRRSKSILLFCLAVVSLGGVVAAIVVLFGSKGDVAKNSLETGSEGSASVTASPTADPGPPIATIPAIPSNPAPTSAPPSTSHAATPAPTTTRATMSTTPPPTTTSAQLPPQLTSNLGRIRDGTSGTLATEVTNPASFPDRGGAPAAALTMDPAGDAWFSATTPESDSLAAIDALTTRLCNDMHWNILGLDLKNEPWDTTWGDNGPRDFRVGAATLGNHMLHKCPSWLAFVEGNAKSHTIDIKGHTFEYYDWWGGGLQKSGEFPLTLDVPAKIVWAPHYYSPSVYPQTFLVKNATRGNDVLISYSEWSDDELNDIVHATSEDMFGYLRHVQDGAIVFGEFGGLYALDAHPNKTSQRVIQDCMKVMKEPGYAGGYMWSLNPESGYGFNPSSTAGYWEEGLLKADWVTANMAYLNALQILDDMPHLHPFPCFSP